MLTYTLNNKPFLLRQDTSVRLTYNNPACNFKDFPGDKGMGIDIPVNDTNRALLGNPERFEKYANANEREFPNFEIRFGGKLLMSGTLIINTANTSQYSGWLRSNIGNIGEKHREKFIYDIPAFNEEVEFDNKSNYNPLTDHYACPSIRNNKFFYDKGRMDPVPTLVPNPDWYYGSPHEEYTTEDMDVSVYDRAFNRTILSNVNLRPSGAIPNSTCAPQDVASDLDVYVISPMLFINYLLKELFKDANFFIDKNDIADHPALKNLILYNNFDIGVLEYATHTNFWELINSPHEDGVINYTGIVHGITRKYPGFKYKWLLPKVKLKDFLIGLQNLVNVCFHLRHDGKVDIIDREKILDTPAFDIDKYLISKWEMNERKDVSMKFSFSHDPDDTFFQQSWEDIDDRRDMERDPVDTWEDLAALENTEIGEIRFLKNENVYAEYALTEKIEGSQAGGNALIEDTLGWKRLSYGFQNGYINPGKDEEENIETIFSTLFHSDGLTLAYQPGNMRGKRFAFQNFTPRVLFYLGGNTCNNFDLVNNLMLDWEKEDVGLLDARYKKWARFWSNRQPAQRKAILPLNVLDYMIRNIVYPFSSREGVFIIEKMDFTINATSIGPTTLTVYKV